MNVVQSLHLEIVKLDSVQERATEIIKSGVVFCMWLVGQPFLNLKKNLLWEEYGRELQNGV